MALDVYGEISRMGTNLLFVHVRSLGKRIGGNIIGHGGIVAYLCKRWGLKCLCLDDSFLLFSTKIFSKLLFECMANLASFDTESSYLCGPRPDMVYGVMGVTVQDPYLKGV